MGWVREKYTKSYFTGFSEDGTKLNYGIEGTYDQTASVLRDFDIRILDRVNFKDAHVFEIGFGRCESLKYFMDKEILSYTGIDFASPAFELAKDYAAHHGFSEARLFCADALEFLRDQSHEIKQPIDIVIMLDVVEHIPRDELRQILALIKPFLAERAILIVNTPIYRVDNDVIANGLDEKNHIDAIDHADFIEETKGMHCNKYSFISLPEFMKQHDFINLTQRQIYSLNFQNNDEEYKEILSFRNLWKKALEYGYPLHDEYKSDEHEFAYIQENPLESIVCDNGILSGLTIVGGSSQFQHYINEYDDVSLDIKAGDIVFDVGGYIGLSSLHFSRLTENRGQIFCFEPNPANLNRMQTNFSENIEEAENIKLYDFGLGEKAETLALLLSDNIEFGYSSTSQLIKGGKTAIPQSTLYSMGFYEKDIKIETLDNFVKSTGIVPNFIKVDIEGAEVSFLRGAIETLCNHSITLAIEIHSPLSAHYTLEILNAVGYKTHVLSELWGNRIEIIAKKQENAPKLLSYIQQFLDLHGAHRLKSLRENELQLLEETQAQLQETQAQLQETQTQFQETQTQFQETQTQLQTQLQETQTQLNKYESSEIIKQLKKVKTLIS